MRRQWRAVEAAERKLARKDMETLSIASYEEARAALVDSGQDPARRSAAAYILAVNWPNQGLPVLLGAIRENNELLAWGVAHALAALRSAKATRELLSVVRGPAAPASRKAAIYALGFLRDRRAVGVLARILAGVGREDDELRDLAADALGSLIGDRRALRALMAAHEDASDGVRFAVINALTLRALEPRVRDLLQQHAGDAGRPFGRPSIAELVRAALGGFEPQA